MIYKIHKTIDPILREGTEKVTDFGFEFQEKIDAMIETMYKRNGIGLAAPQVGFSEKIFICGFEGDEKNDIESFPTTVFCNPEITYYSDDKKLMVEGCLSFPGLEMVVNRPKEVTIKAQDRHGNDFEIKADGLFARVIQHEFDHLNSTLMIDKNEKHKVIFIGTGTLGVPTLEALARDSQYNIGLVVTGEDKKMTGRHKGKENPIYPLAKRLGLTVIRTGNIKSEEIIGKIKEVKPDLGIMADFGQIVPKAILDIPKYGILNIHPSLLPLHRGPSPVQYTILEGDRFGGVTIMLTSPKMDAGPIISQGKVELSDGETSTTLKDYLAEFGANLLLNSIPYYIAGDLKPKEQNESKATYSQMIKKEDGLVDETTPAEIVDRKIRAFDTWPKVSIMVGGRRIQLIAAHFEPDGDFVIDLVKPEGKNIMNYQDYLRGYKKEIRFEK